MSDVPLFSSWVKIDRGRGGVGNTSRGVQRGSSADARPSYPPGGGTHAA